MKQEGCVMRDAVQIDRSLSPRMAKAMLMKCDRQGISVHVFSPWLMPGSQSKDGKFEHSSSSLSI